jgi:putative membrane protein
MRLAIRLAIIGCAGAAAAGFAATPAEAATQGRAAAPTAQAGAVTVATVAGAPQAATHGSVTAPAARHRLAPTDRAFLVKAHQGNLAEISAGRVALAKSRNATVRHIAQQLIVDHRRLDADVRALAAKYHVKLPSAPSAQQRHDLAVVAHKSGAAFDRAWLLLQKKAHQQTLALIRVELRCGHAPLVKAAARKARPVVAMHLAMVVAALHHR